MFTQLVEILEQMSHLDITESPNFRAAISFRDCLKAKGVNNKLAYHISIAAKFELNGDFTDAEILKLVGPLATIAKNMMNEFRDEGYSDADLMTLGHNFNVQLDK